MYAPWTSDTLKNGDAFGFPIRKARQEKKTGEYGNNTPMRGMDQ